MRIIIILAAGLISAGLQEKASSASPQSTSGRTSVNSHAKLGTRKITFDLAGKKWAIGQLYKMQHFPGTDTLILDVGDYLGRAKGTVTVPSDADVQLQVAFEWADDLTPLSRLAPNDLQSIKLAGVPIHGKGFEPIAHLQGLKHLDLTASEADDAALRYIVAIKGLQYLSLKNTSVSEAGVQVLSSLKKLKNLNIAHNAYSDNATSFISSLVELEALNVGGNKIGSQTCRRICKLPKLNRLRLEDSQVDDQDVMLVVAALPNLQELDLSVTGITDKGLAKLSSLKKLRSLSLCRTQTTDRGLSYLAKTASLTGLRLNDTKITDRGLVHLTGLKNLSELDLSGTGVTDQGLATLYGMKQLRKLAVNCSGVTNNGRAQMARHLPGCKVVEVRLHF